MKVIVTRPRRKVTRVALRHCHRDRRDCVTVAERSEVYGSAREHASTFKFQTPTRAIFGSRLFTRSIGSAIKSHETRMKSSLSFVKS
jgi:hypothetical protein